ncbi:MAG TPA: histidine kinase, partial [Streptosporangiaceae bacterium]|nr:histidine kinase [Streptosporangiaceae bacterium]
AVIELNVAVGGGAGAAPLDALSWTLGAVIALPLLVHRRWPRAVLLITFATMILFYVVHRRNISPAPLMFVPTYDVAVAGYLALAITVPAVIMVAGLFAVGLSGTPLVNVLAGFLPSFVIFILAVALGEVVRGRRALAAETARRLELAEEEQRSEAARLLAEERLRIARELHDTVAHSMATITVQAGSALHVLSPAHDGAVREALVSIRETSKTALGEMRAVLGQLREGAGAGALAGPAPEGLGLGRLPELRAAVTAAGSPVRVSVEGEPGPLPPAVDHAAYRILQESLTNVLRHAVSGTEAEVSLRYAPDSVTITVANDGCVPGGPPGTGNGLRGMRERATAAGGELEAGPRSQGGFLVTAKLPRQAAPLPERRERPERRQRPDSPRTGAPA